MRGLAAALRFLTVFPVPGKSGMLAGAAGGPASPAGGSILAGGLSGSVPWFPVVGLLLGLLSAGAAWLLADMAPPALSAALVTVLLLALSGGLHLDGLSDTADGFLSSRPRARVLEIMKDSHVGVMGVAAVFCVLLIKFSALASVGPDHLWKAAFVIPLAGRTAIVIQMVFLPYVRRGGLGTIFQGRAGWGMLAWSVLVLVFACLFAGGSTGMMAAVAGIGAALVMVLVCRRRIGGATGDTYGAACELAEAAAAVAIAMGPQ